MGEGKKMELDQESEPSIVKGKRRRVWTTQKKLSGDPGGHKRKESKQGRTKAGSYPNLERLSHLNREFLNLKTP